MKSKTVFKKWYFWYWIIVVLIFGLTLESAIEQNAWIDGLGLTIIGTIIGSMMLALIPGLIIKAVFYHKGY